ncbi:DUF2958 domain-containing protein [Candidatus Sumerlaeota bacterium]|nr:DUF2958 domain-containing protein [Candidatus Sumerlaeota bacterium]
MWNEPTERQLSALPSLYSTENVPLEEKIIHMHFFLGGCDWFMAEYDPTDRLFFGYVILNDDLENAEWGYTSFDEMRSIRTRHGLEIDRDLHWHPNPVSQIPRIWI